MSNEIKNNKMCWETLPKWENGRYKGKVNWKNSIGHRVKFIYEGIIGELEIVDYGLKRDRYLTLKYNDDVFYDCIYTSDFKDCKIGNILMVKTKEFKIKIDENIKDSKRNLIITNQLYKSDSNGIKRKYYQYKCNKCGFDCGRHYKNGELKEELWVDECVLLQGCGCPCCCSSPQITVPEINSIWATDYCMVDLGVSEADAKRYTKTSNKKITVVCKHCKREKKMIIYNINIYKSICCSCGDGGKYPEKFMTELLNQLKIDYETEYAPKWSSRKRYDFYIPSSNMIIETHGEQHPTTKNHNKNSFNGNSIKELENDIYKEELAKDNGIKNYIIIDCSLSNMDFIKNEILNSKLAELYDLSNIDWLECEKFALKNIVKEVCDYWNQKEEWETTIDMAIMFRLNKATIIKYLHKGTKLGWCNYNAKDEKIKSAKINGKSNNKPTEIFKNNISLGVFESAINLSEQSYSIFGVNLLASKIRSVCLGKQKQHKGYTFRYITKEEYEQRKSQSA